MINDFGEKKKNNNLYYIGKRKNCMGVITDKIETSVSWLNE